MKFDEKLNMVFKSLTLKNTTIAKRTNVDPSLISRFRTGLRLPKSNNPQLDKLCEGIVDYAAEHDTLRTITSLIGAPSDITQEQLKDSLKDWLLTISDPVVSSGRTMIDLKAPKFLMNFGEKLDKAMTLLDLSNISLSHAIGIDPSLISRFRNGTRTPSTRNDAMTQISTFLYNEAEKCNKVHDLLELAEFNPAYVNNNKELIIANITDWLNNRREMAEHSALVAFLTNVNYVSGEEEYDYDDEIDIKKLLDSSIDESSNVYTGHDGLRKATSRLVANILNSDKANVVNIFTDQNFKWLKEIDGFIDAIIAAFNYALSEKELQINILHSMNHAPEDTFFEIERFLPVHVHANINSFYLPGGYSRYLSNTFLIAPGVGAVVGNVVLDNEDAGRYYYYDNNDDINYYNKQYESLIANSALLLEKKQKKIGDKPHFALENLQTFPDTKVYLQYSLPIAGLSEDMFKSLLACNNITDKDTYNKLLYAYHKAAKAVDLSKKITNYISLANLSPVPSESKLASTNLKELLSNKHFLLVTVDLGLEDTDLPKVFYSREVYIQHIKELVNILNNNPGFDVISYEMHEFFNLKLLNVGGHCIMTANNDSDVSTMIFNNAYINKIFGKYMTTLSKKRPRKRASRKTSARILFDHVKYW
ncbi:MAG: helix-turn-helix domain-containing protein [Lachnospiraceae bacterium]|nr:helix-turn-helix domain-containing protein [Lachnospiraceae bacterium]